MQSSTGKYFIGLDHIRAIAAFLVFTWHFIHINDGHYATPPALPFSLLSEGHTGVALFMTLSGYLFAKLLDGKKIIYHAFLWNRFLRLAPLLTVVSIAVGLLYYLAGMDLIAYAKSITAGFIKPSLPNGGWSITVEFHFYLLLPLLLFLVRKWKYSLLIVLLAAVTMRTFLYQELGEIQTLAYWTIIGRIDQFLLGMLAFQFSRYITGRHFLILGVFCTFVVFYKYFDSLGGFYNNPSYPSPSSIWIYLSTVEGLAYGLLIAWYDNSFVHSQGRFSRFIANIGSYSYSIYLLHVFVVFKLAAAVNEYIIELSNSYISYLFSVLCFLLMIPIAYLSYRFIEMPFLRFRRQYIVRDS